MAELTPADVESFTDGLLKADNPETAQLLSRALAGARRYCGWAVTPPQVDAVIGLDGPGTRHLVLPTMNLTAVSACTELGVVVDPTTLAWSRQGLVAKPNHGRWSCELGSIQMTVTHGYSEDDAADWRGAVLAACDLAAQNVGSQLQKYRVDDIERDWYKASSFQFNRSLLDPYRLMGVA